MISLSWYNIVAIVIGILSIGYLININRNIPKTGFLAGLDEFIETSVTVIILIIFFLIWGGIFWW